MKYDIVISQGCMAFYTTINGKNVNDLSAEEKNEFIDYLLATVKTRIEEQNIDLNSLIEIIPCDDYDSAFKPCDQCGDTVLKSKWHI